MSGNSESKPQVQVSKDELERRIEKAVKRVVKLVLRRMPVISDDGAYFEEVFGDTFDIEGLSAYDLFQILNKELAKHGLVIVRLTDTGDVDWYGVLPTSVLQSIFPNARNPLEATHYFNICVSLNAGWQIAVTDEEWEAIRGRCSEVEKITRTIMPSS